MAKTFTEQTRLWAADDDASFGDGYPVHSTLPYDLPTWLNNLASKVDPCFQFLRYSNGGQGSLRGTAWTFTGSPTSGELFMGEAPILLRPDAKYMKLAFGVKRTLGAEAAIAHDVLNLNLYLCHGPAGNAVTDPWIDPSLLRNIFDKRTIAVNATSAATADHYTFVDDSNPGWLDYGNKVTGLRDALSDRVVTGVFTLDIVNASVDLEGVRLEEVSIWFDYE